MLLSKMVGEMKNAKVVGSSDPDILSVVSDSRQVAAGALFAALPGSKGDGADFIQDAIKRGAAAVLASALPNPPPAVPVVVVPDARKGLGEAADGFYRHPAASLDLIGVTGTNGKTTTAYLLRHLLNHAGRRCGMLGTVQYDVGGKLEPAPLTTPDTVRFTRSLAEMRDAGCRAAVVEASSHAIDQERIWPHRFAAAIFTNLTRDHLDYHGTMEAYREAKRGLFARLDSRAVAVLNFRDPAARRMAEGVAARVTGYVLADSGASVSAPNGAATVRIVASDLAGQTFRVDGAGLSGEFRTPLVGGHNVENCLGAMLAALGLGVGAADIASAMADFPGVPGRLERIEAPNGAVAFVDFAHTDGALHSVLSVLRPLVKGKLITVFGCGGDRDKGKRPLMAKAAEAHSDRVVVTSDNPRTEDPLAIINDIMPGFARPERVSVEPDRAGAVRLALRGAGAGDAVLVAGKGHEDYQIIGTEKRHLDDRELVREAMGRS